jgi:flavin reductase (DIM6/NTAB) family NADH-FMN oxidoreductase RutF
MNGTEETTFMKKDMGAKLMVYPTPIYLVATYDRNGNPNVMTVGWGGVCCSNPPCVAISVRKATHTYHALVERNAFTVNLGTEDFAKEASYFGKASGKNENKFEKSGLTPVKSGTVDAPYIEEMPVNIECKIIHTTEIGSHIQFIGQIVNVKVSDTIKDNGVPIIEQMKPIVYGVGNDHHYYKIGEAITVSKENV